MKRYQKYAWGLSLALTLSMGACQKPNQTTQMGQQAVTLDWKSYSGDANIERKVDSLLSIMTLEEKIGQMAQFSGHSTLTGPAINDNYKEYLEKGQVGSMFNLFGAKTLRQMQEIAISKSRLGIPVLFAADVIHGYKTTFPMPLAESCSWDLALMERSARIAAIEATAAGISWTFAPMVDVARDARWGRVMEGAGEDVYLGNLVAKARVRGFQGIETYKDFAKPNTMLACAKHFAAYGAAEAGRDYNTVDISDRTLRNTYLPPFKASVEAGVATFMTAFNEIEGVPASGNKYLFEDILRGEWDFRGTVVTDYTAINEMIDHGYAKDLKEASEKALKAGIDMDMTGAGYVQYVKQLVDEGKIDVAYVDRAAARILELKFLLGLFDDPFRYMDEKREAELVGHPDHMAEARRNAQRSIVLLKNDQQTLPLKSGKRVALIGPMIKERNSINGEWAIVGDRNESVTVFEGLQERYKDGSVKLSYAQGCDLQLDGKKTHAADPAKIAEAVRLAQQNDLLVVALGEDFNWSGEAASRSDITLPAAQKELLHALKKTGKPIVLVLLNGRPLDLSWEDANVQSIVEAWYPGTMGGHAIADVLSGDYNPSAKLTMSFPRNVGQLPLYYNAKNTGRPFNEKNPADYRSFYLDVSNTPLYPFGHGLSYTEYAYNNLRLSNKEFGKGEAITVQVDVTNKGAHDGEEIVQLYLQDIAASVTRPVMELKGFEKVAIKKGETKTISFRIDEDAIKLLDLQKQWTAEAGDFNVWVGKSSADKAQHAKFTYTGTDKQ